MRRRSKHKIIVIGWIAGFFLLGSGVWSFQGGELMIIAYTFLGAFAYAIYAFLARCPQCGMPLLIRTRIFFGMEIYTWSLLTPLRCRHCNAEIR